MNAFSGIQSVFYIVLLISITVDVAFAGEGKSAEVADYSIKHSIVVGEELFYRQWRGGTFETKNNGLGPLYNAKSCIACHINNGRGRPPLNNLFDPSFILRLSIPPQNEGQRLALALEKYASVAEPRYGRQLQDKSIVGSENGEGEIRVEYRDKPYLLADGEVVVLHRPIYAITYLRFGKLHKNLQISPRIAQPLHGIGLLAAIPNDDILAQEDPRDEDKDGISGRANMVLDIAADEIALGRFGWKATQPNLLQQTAAAFAQDIGIKSSLFAQTAQGCTQRESHCLATNSRPNDTGKIEILDDELKSTAQYISLFPVLQRYRTRSSSAEQFGEKLFTQVGCVLCHRKSYQIRARNLEGKIATKTIYPYSDLLLHDMGAGLADHRPVAQASGWEWRTQPLWGIGKIEKVNGNTFYLHDGRARTIIEAILWHGGEARSSRSKFAALNKKQRAALIEFINEL